MPGRPVYSAQFVPTEETTTFLQYVVPDGFVAVVRDMRFTATSFRPRPSGNALLVSIDTTTAVIWTIDAFNCNAGTYTWLGHQVFRSQMSITVWPLAYGFAASGYLLATP